MTGASGVGKDTIRHEALPAFPDIHYSISATTREQRPGENDGQNYHFVSREHFLELIRRDELLEYAEYVADFYGTPIGPAVEALEVGQDVLVDLVLADARQVRARLPEARMLFTEPATPA